MEMNSPNQMSSSAPPPDVTAKRKRGRPRKERTENPIKSAYIPRKRIHNLNQNHGEGAPVPPGFEAINGNQPPPQAQLPLPPPPPLPLQPPPVTVQNNRKEDSVIGQVVTGVIEAVFDAGYLLSVRVGDSDTSLRGVVFKPGHYVPVCAENDVAPTLQMIQRNSVPLPTTNQGKKRRGREKTTDHRFSYPSNGSPNSNQLVKARANQMAIVPVSPHPIEERGKFVPVVLQPMNLSNGATPVVEAPRIASQPAHLATSKVKLPSWTKDGTIRGTKADIGSVSESKKGSSENVETRNDSGKSGVVYSNNNSGLTQEQVQELSKPLLVKPLQAIRSGTSDQHASLPLGFDKRRTGKMTELLMAVQENLMERQIVDNHNQEFKNPKN